MTKLLPAIYERGKLKLLKPVGLPEHQKVLIAIAISNDEIPAMFISKLAEKSDTVQFLSNPQEDIYSLSDGEEI